MWENPVVLTVILLWCLTPPFALFFGVYKGIQHGEKIGAEEMRRTMLRHPSMARRRPDKRVARSA